MYEEYIKLNKKKLSNQYKGIYLFQVKCDDGLKQFYQYYIVDFDKMKISFSDSEIDKFDVKFMTDDATMLKIINKQANPSKLIESKLIKTEGKKEYFSTFSSDFFPTVPKL